MKKSFTCQFNNDHEVTVCKIKGKTEKYLKITLLKLHPFSSKLIWKLTGFFFTHSNGFVIFFQNSDQWEIYFMCLWWSMHYFVNIRFIIISNDFLSWRYISDKVCFDFKIPLKVNFNLFFNNVVYTCFNRNRQHLNRNTYAYAFKELLGP